MSSHRSTPLARFRAGVGLVEAAVAAGLLGMLLVPLLNTSTQGVLRTKRERTRVVAAMLGSNALALCGQRSQVLDYLLQSSLSTPDSSVDLLTVPAIAAAIGANPYAALIREQDMQIHLTRTVAVLPGADLLVCDARWHSQTRGKKEEEHVSFERLLVDGAF